MAIGCMIKLLPILAMLLLQVIQSVVNVLSKLALNNGMQPFVFVTYRQVLGAIAIAPFAICLERKTWPKFTRHILLLSLLNSVFGATLHQLLLFFGLQRSTPVISVAIDNTLPALTFIVAVIFRQEMLSVSKWPSQAKILGTCICVGGASILSFYHGGYLTKHHSSKLSTVGGNKTTTVHGTAIGAVLIILSNLSAAVWLIIQTRLNRKFLAPLTNTTLLCFFSSVQCAVISLIIDHRPSAWAIKTHIQLAAILYAGLVSSAIGFFLISWTAGKKGPLYVSVFGPLSLIIVAVLSWALLDEILYRGKLYGALLIIVGVYMVLWGKSKEPEVIERTNQAEECQGELGMPNLVAIKVIDKEHEEKVKV